MNPIDRDEAYGHITAGAGRLIYFKQCLETWNKIRGNPLAIHFETVVGPIINTMFIRAEGPNRHLTDFLSFFNRLC